MKNTRQFSVTFLGTCSLGLTLLVVPALGQGLGIERGPYLNFGAGLNFMSAEFHADTGMRFSAAGGYNFNKWTGLELETGFLYNRNVGSKVHASGESLAQVPLMANFVLRYENEAKVTPYVGFGLGADLMFGGSRSYGAVAYQPMAGVRYEINDKMSVGIGYKYLGYALTAMFGFVEGNHGVVAEFNLKF